MDGTQPVRMCTDVISAIHDASTSASSPTPSPPSPVPVPLDFDVPTSLSSFLTIAKSHAESVVTAQSLTYLLTPYGSSFPKKHGVSPDAWVQMMIQLAFSRLVGEGKPLPRRSGGAYEAATTRRFLRGRTERIRVVSEESDAFCDAMNRSDTSKLSRIDLLRRATGKHVVRAKEAGMGEGIDRHLLGKLKEHAATFIPPLTSITFRACAFANH